MNEIQQWLINIQARAPNSPVIIVGKYKYTQCENYGIVLSPFFGNKWIFVLKVKIFRQTTKLYFFGGKISFIM